MTNPGVRQSSLAEINQNLPQSWEARLNLQGRIFYVNHHTQTSQWIPPKESWTSQDNGVPYGLEPALSKTGKAYFINHVDKTTVREESEDNVDSTLSLPRDVELQRDEELGFGFIAGSEKPVIVRSVTEGGPSEDKLLPGDQVLRINGEDVAKAEREHVIELVRACKESISLTVCQPQIDNSLRKSALLSAAKKARLKNHPSRVRFAEDVIINGAPVVSPSTQESYIPFMPNVLKVFLENGQTKSFKYDNKTTVKDVINSLQEKLNISCIEHFSLVLQNVKRPCQGGITLLQEHESLAEIAARPGSQHFKCLLRVMFVPKDAYDLLRKDTCAFEYFYMQCCSDVVQERYASEMKYDIALRLAALNIQQYAISNNMSKISIKTIERDCGLERFVPRSLLSGMKTKELRKMLNHYMKANQNLSAPGQKLTALQAKLHYLKIVGELRSFGSKCFMATLVEKKSEVMVLVGPKYGIAVVTNIKANAVSTLADYSDVQTITVTKETERVQRVVLHLKDQDNPRVTLSILGDEVHEFVALVEGYYKLYVDKTRNLLVSALETTNNNKARESLPYEATHRVVPQPWSYPEASEGKVKASKEEEANQNQPEKGKSVRLVDLANGPPPYSKEDQHLENKKSEVNAQKPKVTNNETADKPQELKVTEVVVEEAKEQAPLASPDVSTLSGSSESSIAQDEGANGTTTADKVGPFGDAASLGSDTTEDVKDSDSVTSSSVSTVISRSSTHVDCSTDEQPSPMSHSDSDYDARFGARALKTFSPSHEIKSAKPADDDVNEATQNAEKSQSPLKTDPQTLNDANKLETTLAVKDATVNETGVDSETDTETDSMVTESEGEQRALLPPSKIEVDIVPYSQSESDDTDSISTPTDSPCKARLDSLDVKPPALSGRTDRPQSFGMHSPDKLPKSETEFQKIACSFGLHSPEKGAPQELLHPTYNRMLFSDGQLYLDPDIIDLTLIPPPKTPDQEVLIDFANPSLETPTPPPGFSDDSGSPTSAQGSGGIGRSGENLPTAVVDLPTPIRERIDAMISNDEEIGSQLAAIDALMIGSKDLKMDEGDEKESGIESESDSGNETISSENIDLSGSGFHELLGSCASDFTRIGEGSSLPVSANFQHDDIDAFIASVTVPPPPSSEDQGEQLGLVPQGAPRKDGAVEVVAQDQTYQGVSQDLALNRQFVTEAADHRRTGDVPSATASQTQLDYVPPLSPISEDNSWKPSEILDDEIAKLVIPPPPESSTPNLDDIPIVPPVDVKTPSPSSERGSPPQQKDSSFSLFSHPIHALTRSSNSASQLCRPSVGVDHQRSSSLPVDMTQDKPRPPVPPKRLSSLESPSSTGSSAPTSPITHSLGGANGSSPRLMPDSHRSPQWRPAVTQNQQTMDDNSSNNALETANELYAKRLVTTMGTLPRLRGRKNPPPPPPRRSSIASTPSGSSNSPIKTPPVDSNQRYAGAVDAVRKTYENMFQPPTKPELERKSSNDSSDDNAQIKVTPGSAIKNPKLRVDINKCNDLSSPKKNTVQSPRVVQMVERIDSPRSADSSPSKSKIKAYVSPTIQRRQTEYLENACRDVVSTPGEIIYVGSASPKVGRSETFSPGSPRGSPAVQRHGSFSQVPERSPSPFRTFLGDKSPQGGSNPSSPLRSPGIPPQPSLAAAKAALRPVSSIADPAQTKENGNVDASSKIVQPLVSSTSRASSSASSVSSASSSSSVPDVVSIATQNLMEGHTRSPGSPRPMSSFSSPNHAGAKLPASPRRSGTATLPGSPRRNGPVHQSPRSGIPRPAVPVPTVPTEGRKNGAVSQSDSVFPADALVQEIINKTYIGDNSFEQANKDVDILVTTIDKSLNRLDAQGQSKKTDTNFKAHKESLLGDSRTFVTDSKLLVSSATHSKEKLVQNVNTSMHTLARIVKQYRLSMLSIKSTSQAINLGSKVKDVTLAYRTTLNAAHDAAGKPLSDPNMKMLMRQATSLAAILSSLMKTIKSLDNK